eukprot:108528_1
MTTWLFITKNNCCVKQPKQLKVESRPSIHKKCNDQQKRKSKSNIPIYVRYEKEINSDDDMIISNDNTNDTENDININMISEKDFILNHFHKGQRFLLFQFIIPFCDKYSAVDFLECFQKYCKLLTPSNSKNHKHLLKFWKCLYERIPTHERKIWSIKFRSKRSRNRKTNRTRQVKKYNAKVNDYKYWKSAVVGCEYDRPEIFTVKYKNNKLTFWAKQYNLHSQNINKNYIIVVFPFRDIHAEYLTTIYYTCSFYRMFYMNWYAIAQDYQLKRDQIIDGNYQHGFKNINVLPLMENFDICERGINGNVQFWEYHKYYCYLLEIDCIDGNNGNNGNNLDDGFEFKQCRLLTDDGAQIKGLLLNKLVNIKELEMKFEECEMVFKMRMLVYKMQMYRGDYHDYPDTKWIVVELVSIEG